MTTIIRVKYIEWLSNHNDVEYSETTCMEKEMLVNINCPIRTILDYIRKVARIKGEYDLCDEIKCQLKNVFIHKPHIRGTDILQADVTYIIVTFDRDEHGQMTNLVPLLIEKASKTNSDILCKMRKPSRKTKEPKKLKKRN